MRTINPQNLKIIHFEGEMLPKWAQLLDLAARLCPVSEDTREWFSRFTNSPGVEDARIVLDHCELLRLTMQKHRESLADDLQRGSGFDQSAQILGAWTYALDTMIQEAREKRTCSWTIAGNEQAGGYDAGGGEITLRRV